MALVDYKIEKYERPISSLPDVPSTGGYDAKTLKEYFDGSANNEIKKAINAIIDFLVVLTGNETIKGFKMDEDDLTYTTDGANYIDIGYSKLEVDEKLILKANKSEVLTKTNTAAFTPTGEYQPATKKYVDAKVFEAGAGDMAQAVYDPNGYKTDIFAYAMPKIKDAMVGNLAAFDENGKVVDGGIAVVVSEDGVKMVYEVEE